MPDAAAALLVTGCSAEPSTESAVNAAPTAPTVSETSPLSNDSDSPTEDAARQTSAAEAGPSPAGPDTSSAAPDAMSEASDSTAEDEPAAKAEPSADDEPPKDEPTAKDEPAAKDVPASGTAAGADVAEVVVYDAPNGTATQTFANPTATGTPLTFMVTSTADEWLQVQLPVRPNGSTGWVRATDVTVFEVDYALRVSTADNTLDVFRDGVLIDTFSVAAGTGETPTPLGTYYLTELIAPTNKGYGPYAYGISAFSDVLNEFGGGPGQIGLHGTDDQGSIGQDVSHGCIRLANEDITALAALLPLGTPIQIT